MAIMTFRGLLSPAETVSEIKRRFHGTALSCQLVDEAHKFMGSTTASLLVYEKYFMRAKNRVSLSIMITSDMGVTDVFAIGSGGGQGPLFSFSWGSEEDFVSSFSRIIKQIGFDQIA